MTPSNEGEGGRLPPASNLRFSTTPSPGEYPKPPVLVLFGPTASGKTDILQRLFGSNASQPAEVVSADSMQVYRDMDIGTAKPTAAERAELPHHLINIRDPHEQFTVGDFVRLADAACVDISARGKLPVVSGGAGFYLKNFILGLPEAPPSDAAVRAQLKQELTEKGAAVLMAELAATDSESAARIHINDEYRLLRALEVLRLCGRPLSSFSVTGAQAEAASGCRPQYRFLIIGLTRPREDLYRRVNERCAAMFRSGLPAEARRLYEAGYTPEDPGIRAIGYREFFVKNWETSSPAWRFAEDTAGVEALVAQNSRRYAKRQTAFFASIPGVTWIHARGGGAETAEQVQRELDAFVFCQTPAQTHRTADSTGFSASPAASRS